MMGPTEPVVPGVIAYNGDSQRGWNDPPTLSYAGITASKKGPKLDLRKRVSHQEALTGRKVTSPSIQNYNPGLLKQANQPANNSSHVGKQPPPQSPEISPHHSRNSSGTFTPPLIPENEPFINPLQPSTNYFIPSSSTMGSAVGQPIPTAPMMQSFTSQTYPHAPPILPSARQAPPPIASPVSNAPPTSGLGKPLFSPKALSMTPVSSALDTCHVRSNPEISLDATLEADNCLHNVPNTTNGPTLTPLIFTPSNNFQPSYPSNNAGKGSPVLGRGTRPNLYMPPVVANGRNSPIPPPPITNNSPISTPITCLSGHNTPRSSSPETAVKAQKQDEDFDSLEALNTTVDGLEEIILRCSTLLQNREVVDVKKKLEIMKQQWEDKKLSVPVQKSTKSLTEALLNNDAQTAHTIHLQLMVEYVGEVKLWMVAIKRLISAVGNLQAKLSS